ncbi:purine nucleoside permease [Microthyrium microscopicum]|uniref:Purine nucleoside permease n=1 Tax=Microthyrium microscopicum TaxID=703497 RepID=A0A6A6UCQ1_9PEZI|nr:purine nucleoside permease [Microthyrium microscopicum]
MFTPEAAAWWDIPEFNVLAENYTLPGLSPIYPNVTCTSNGDVCQITVGESEINAASSISALVLSPIFNLTETYFMIAGIAGVNPQVASSASVTLARFSVQFALSYEIDPREAPSTWATGYSVAFGDTEPGLYPGELYGTEVFEVNADLRSIAAGFAKTATLNDSATAVTYRANFSGIAGYEAGAMAPSVIECDGVTSDVWFSGDILSSYAANWTTLLTNGTGLYCATAEEDNATLEVLLRGALAGLVDFGRIIVMRTGSDYDRPYPGQAAADNLLYSDQGAFPPSIANLYLAGVKIVEGILDGWDTTFKAGVKPSNYIGDIFGSLGGTPDYGPGTSSELPTASKKKRSTGRKDKRWNY